MDSEIKRVSAVGIGVDRRPVACDALCWNLGGLLRPAIG
jgi:hypothetical protein